MNANAENKVANAEVQGTAMAENPVQKSPLLAFGVRAAIVAIAITASLSWVFDTLRPDTSAIKRGIKKALEARETRLRLNGWLSTNPRVNLEVANILEKKGNLQGALDEISVAIGILERAGGRPEVIAQYQARADALKAALASEAGKNQASGDGKK